MKTDKLFYRIFQELPQIFFELIGESNVDASAYEFKAPELKETALRLDGVMCPKAKNRKQPIYFMEVQNYKNEKTYSNLFAKVFTYLNQNDPEQNWRAVVIYERRSFEPEETEPYEALLNSHQVVRVYLDEIEETTESSLGIQIVKLIFEKEKNAVNRGKQIIAEAQESLTDDKETEQVLELIQTILLYKLSNLSREELQAMRQTVRTRRPQRVREHPRPMV